MTPFEPVNGQARWKTIYALFQESEIDEIVTYEVIGERLELHPVDDRHAIQMAARRAAKQYLEDDDRAVEPVQNVGYRIVEPQEHLRLAQAQQKRSNRSLSRGHKTVMHVDLNGMEPEVRKAFDITARAFATLLEYNRRLDIKQKNLEQSLNSIVHRQDRSDEEIAALKQRLARLESQSED